MKKTIKVKGNSLQDVREKYKKELPDGIFLLHYNEWDSFERKTEFYRDSSVEKATEKAKNSIPAYYDVMEILKIEVDEYKDRLINVQAINELDARLRVENHYRGQNHYNFSVIAVQLIKKGFSGIMGIGKIENTYQVQVYDYPNVRIIYKTWAGIVAEITDEVEIANRKFFEYVQYGSFDKEGFKRLLSQGVDVNCHDENGKNALFYLSDSIIDDDISNTMRFFIEKGIDINHCDNMGRNILFQSCHIYNISKFLIDKGIDYRKTNILGDNILSYRLRNNKTVDNKIKEFLENNGIKQDEAIIKEMSRAERQAAEDRKKWCPNCQKKVNTDTNYNTIHGHGDDTVDKVDEICVLCGTTIDSYIRESW
jgi:hypothetical protein